MKEKNICPHCKGYGMVDIHSTKLCVLCSGRGEVQTTVNVNKKKLKKILGITPTQNDTKIKTLSTKRI